ncbi:MAG: hypothetical protein ABIT01_18840 [Thermoanaerobaculia bacterium]
MSAASCASAARDPFHDPYHDGEYGLPLSLGSMRRSGEPPFTLLEHPSEGLAGYQDLSVRSASCSPASLLDRDLRSNHDVV